MSIEKICLKYGDSFASESFRYQILGRLQADCEYFLGFGSRNTKNLWAGDVKEQITLMKDIWKSFPKTGKPEWLTWDQILSYEKAMS